MTDIVTLVECPRDAMQGWKTFIPTEKKIAYINNLLQVGFDTIDFGSFVSPKAIPQMADTKEVLKGLDQAGSRSKLLAIAANIRGAEEAVIHEKISYIGYPFSVSETFQQRNTNAGMKEALSTVKEIQKICSETGKQLVVYISMGFGNPYGDPYSEDIVMEWTNKIVDEGVSIIALADTVGLADPALVRSVVATVSALVPGIELGVHLHAKAAGWKEKLESAFVAGATRFDGALKGIGGCPMANDDLVGNMNTEWLLEYFSQRNVLPQINAEALKKSLQLANEIFI